jgi:hypothetical protein
MKQQRKKEGVAADECRTYFHGAGREMSECIFQFRRKRRAVDVAGCVGIQWFAMESCAPLAGIVNESKWSNWRGLERAVRISPFIRASMPNTPAHLFNRAPLASLRAKMTDNAGFRP